MKLPTKRGIVRCAGFLVVLVIVVPLSYVVISSAPSLSRDNRNSLYVARKISQMETASTLPDSTSERPEPTPNSTDLPSRARFPVQMATEMFARHGVVLVTMINDAYFDFAASWSCNTQAMAGVHQRTLFLSTDRATAGRLESGWPGLSVVSLNSSGLGGAQSYSRAGYIRLMAERTRLLRSFLEAGVRVLLFEVDAAWLADPTPMLLARAGQADILATRVTGQDVTAGGFLLLNPTPPTLQLWRRLADMMDDLFDKLRSRKATDPVSEALNDQQFFSALLRKKYAGIKVAYLPADQFPDGKWYTARKKNPNPLIINNNWVSGTKAKKERAKAFGHWFWNEEKQACDSSATQKLVHAQVHTQ